MSGEKLPEWPEYMSAETVARYLDIGVQTARNRMSAESLPTIKRAGFPTRVVKSRLDAMLAEGQMVAIGIER